ncbi:sensor histidine kinase [Desulforhopalus singaporensis]|uniref:histidine kinase n=1 Tax=Desulforhopalus singaporensis TaxID=91360 RepID=A0A1H0UKE2_9BACT|nr:sensor histidine kinase [Desulforhopalus singaporensis]SDP66336.1 PAS domain S-box-containing protein [Desulforhopalus singaporensis]
MNLKRNILIIGGMLMVILVLTVITYNSTRIITEKTVENHQQGIATELANTVELWLEQHMNIIDATARAVREVPIGHNPGTMRILQMATRAGDFADVYVGTSDGIIIVGSGWTPETWYDPRTRPWYRKGTEANRVAFTSPYTDLTTMRKVIAITKPLWLGDTFAGVLSSDIILDTIKKNVLNATIGHSGYSFILDRMGTILVHPESSYEMHVRFQDLSPSLAGVLDYFANHPNGTYDYVLSGRDMILSYKKLSGSEWYLCTTVEKKEAYDLARNTAMLFAMEVVFKILTFLALLTLLVVCGSGAALLLAKRRFDTTVSSQQKLLYWKEKDLEGEISRRKEMETRYQTIFNIATNGILLTRDNVYVECNDRAAEMLRKDRLEIIGKSMLDFSPASQNDGTNSMQRLSKILDSLTLKEAVTFKWMFLRDDGSQFPTEVSLKKFRLDNDVVILSSVWDISKRENAENQLRQAQKMAAMGEMISSIAHQWRQPLNALATYIASIQPAYYNKMMDKQFIEKLVTEADSQIQFMSSTINDFREYVKPSKHKTAFDATAAIENAVKLMKSQLSHSHIELVQNSETAGRKLLVLGYRNEFVHVLVNVLSNGKEAIEGKRRLQKQQDHEGADAITITVSATEKHVVIIIQDTGIGIEESLIGKIFDPYFTTKSTAAGTGIGLYMAKMIVEKEMGGSITVQDLRPGAQFTVELPLVDEEGGKC